MVRRGSTVRVRQRASRKASKWLTWPESAATFRCVGHRSVPDLSPATRGLLVLGSNRRFKATEHLHEEVGRQGLARSKSTERAPLTWYASSFWAAVHDALMRQDLRREKGDVPVHGYRGVDAPVPGNGPERYAEALADHRRVPLCGTRSSLRGVWRSIPRGMRSSSLSRPLLGPPPGRGAGRWTLASGPIAVQDGPAHGNPEPWLLRATVGIDRPSRCPGRRARPRRSGDRLSLSGTARG